MARSRSKLDSKAHTSTYKNSSSQTLINIWNITLDTIPKNTTEYNVRSAKRRYIFSGIILLLRFSLLPVPAARSSALCSSFFSLNFNNNKTEAWMYHSREITSAQYRRQGSGHESSSSNLRHRPSPHTSQASRKIFHVK